MITSVDAFKAMIGWMYGVDYIPPGDENKTYIHAGMYEVAIRFDVPRLRVHALKRVKQSTEIPDSEFNAQAFLRLVNHELYCARGFMRFLLTDICIRKIDLLLKEPELGNVFKNHGHFFPKHLLMGLGRGGLEVCCLECGESCDNEGRCEGKFCSCEEDWRPYFQYQDDSYSVGMIVI